MKSPLADAIPDQHTTWHSKFSTTYEVVRDARNDALHQGAFARHLTNSVIQLALVLEDALMSNASTTGEFMVREPISEGLVVEPADTCFADTSVAEALKMSNGKPLIVIDSKHPERLVGIVTPFDFL